MRVLVVGLPASPVTEFAAAELARYVHAMTGVLPRIETTRDSSSSGAVALLGDNQPLPADTFARLREKLAGASLDAYATHADPDGIVVAGASDRATLCGVYDVLRRLGARFFAPAFPFYDGRNEYVPRLDALPSAAWHVVERPAFAIRRKYVEEGWSHTPRTVIALLDWMAKNRLNVLVCPYDYQRWGVVRWDLWREQVLPEVHKRGILLEVGGHGYQSFLPGFDATSTEHIAAYVTNVVAYLRRRPEIDIFSAWPPDEADWTTASPPEAQANVTRALLTGVRDAGLDVRLSALAYSYTNTLEPPASRFDSSVIIDLATFDRSHAEPISSQRYAAVLDQWRAHQPENDIALHEYYRRYAWRSLPVVLPRLIADDLAFYRERGAHGLGMYSEPADWLTFEANHLQVAELLWQGDSPEWLTSYLENRFGPLAAPLGEYVDLVERAARIVFDRVRGDFSDPMKVKQVKGLYEQAREVLVPLNGWHVERLRLNLDLALADVNEDHQLHRALLERHMFDGIVLAHPSAIRRYDPDIERHAPWIYAAYRRQWA